MRVLQAASFLLAVWCMALLPASVARGEDAASPVPDIPSWSLVERSLESANQQAMDEDDDGEDWDDTDPDNWFTSAHAAFSRSGWYRAIAANPDRALLREMASLEGGDFLFTRIAALTLAWRLDHELAFEVALTSIMAYGCFAEPDPEAMYQGGLRLLLAPPFVAVISNAADTKRNRRALAAFVSSGALRSDDVSVLLRFVPPPLLIGWCEDHWDEMTWSRRAAAVQELPNPKKSGEKALSPALAEKVLAFRNAAGFVPGMSREVFVLDEDHSDQEVAPRLAQCVERLRTGDQWKQADAYALVVWRKDAARALLAEGSLSPELHEAIAEMVRRSDEYRRRREAEEQAAQDGPPTNDPD